MATYRPNIFAFYEVKNRFGHGIGLRQPAAVAPNFYPFLLFLRNGLFCQSLVPRPSLSERKIPFGPSLFSFHLRCLAGRRRSTRQRRKKNEIVFYWFRLFSCQWFPGGALLLPGPDGTNCIAACRLPVLHISIFMKQTWPNIARQANLNENSFRNVPNTIDRTTRCRALLHRINCLHEERDQWFRSLTGDKSICMDERVTGYIHVWSLIGCYFAFVSCLPTSITRHHVAFYFTAGRAYLFF
jgi:hypothetical protein